MEQTEPKPRLRFKVGDRAEVTGQRRGRRMDGDPHRGEIVVIEDILDGGEWNYLVTAISTDDLWYARDADLSPIEPELDGLRREVEILRTKVAKLEGQLHSIWCELSEYF